MTAPLSSLLSTIRSLETKYHRTPNSVKLLAASKAQSSEKILTLYQEGQRVFGENYLQEAIAKMPELPNDIEWHFIGPIQSNKTRKIAEHFSWVHSVSSLYIAKRLNDQRPLNLAPLNICIEVNISEENTKSGVMQNELLSLAKECLLLPQLTLRGLMCIPAPSTDLLTQRKSFHAVSALFESLRNDGINIDTLSMGMSDDLEAAIAEGSTMIRVGRALFGERKK